MNPRGSKQRSSRIGVVAALAVTLAISAACSSSKPSHSSTASPGGAPAKIDESAVLKIGDGIGAAGGRPDFDPTKGTSGEPTGYLRYVYDSLMVHNLDGSYSPELATSATVADPSTIKVTLRSGVTFSDGTPLNAAAVQSTILRNKKANNSATMRAALLQDVASVDVSGATQLTIHLSQPVAGAFYDLLSGIETAPVSPTAVSAGKNLSSDPVGAGPFTLVSQSDSQVTLKKWSGYWDAKDVHLAGIDLIDTESAASGVNALKTNALDYYVRLVYSNLAQLGSSANTLTQLPAGAEPGFDVVNFNCGKNSVLTDVRVRQALAYATDPSQFNSVIYQGKATSMTQLAASGSPQYNASLEGLYSHDVTKAKQLLDQAGKTNLTVPGADETSLGGAQYQTILQQQWAGAGVKLKITPTSDLVNDFYVTGKLQELVYVNAKNAFLDWVLTYFTAGAGGATCAPSDPTYASEVKTLEGLDQTSAEALDLIKKINAYLVQNAYYIPLLTEPVGIAYSKRSTMSFWESRSGTVFPDFRGTSIS